MLEPVKDLKIDLTASRTQQTAKSIQYMYEGMPTTQSGTFNMTTIAIGSAFESMGNATDGYKSKTFDKFVKSLESFRQRVEQRYAGVKYPAGTTLAGQTFDTANGTVDAYSADVMVPAFLKAYTAGGGSLSLFPALSKMLPNWTLRYSGLSRIPLFADIFKSVNLTHSYKCIYAVGAYQSYSTFVGLMGAGGDLGFVNNATTGLPTPSSMYNISTVSINESFSPLLGIDLTFNNNLTTSLEYRQTRVLSLSMTSIQIAETTSKDWVIGMGYKINNFNIFGRKATKKIKGAANKKSGTTTQTTTRSNGVNRDLNLRLDGIERQQCPEALLHRGLHPLPAPHPELLLRPADEHPSAHIKLVSHDYAGLRTIDQILTDEITSTDKIRGSPLPTQKNSKHRHASYRQENTPSGPTLHRSEHHGAPAGPRRPDHRRPLRFGTGHRSHRRRQHDLQRALLAIGISPHGDKRPHRTGMGT